MNEDFNAWGILRKLSLQDTLLVLGIFVLAQLLMFMTRRLGVYLAQKTPSHLRLSILRVVPLIRLLIGIGSIVIIVPILIEPTFQNIIALVASVGLAFGFALKDYGSSVIAGLAVVLENIYQPGDWIGVDGSYGEVKSIGARATRIVTADNTEVIIPHTRLWAANIFNSSSGKRSLLCVADFYLHPDHDAALVRKRLEEVAQISPYRKPESSVTVIVLEKPWGTHYSLKAYVKESHEQFLFLTDLTIRGKEVLRSLGIRFAQAAYAKTKP